MENEPKTEFERKLQIAKDYMNGFADGRLNYNNSSHRSLAVSKFQIALEQGLKEKITEEKLLYVKNKIHFLNTG